MRRVLAAAVLAGVVVSSAGCGLQEQPPVSQKVLDYYSNGPKTTDAAEPTLVTVIGDSYVAGSNMGGNGTANWAALASAELQGNVVVDISRAGVGGSGYVDPGPQNIVFGDIVSRSVGPKTDVIVFFGSINDRDEPAADVHDAAVAVYAKAKKLAPNAKLLVFGPAWMRPNVPAEVTATSAAVRDAAVGAGAKFVDPIAERWFFDKPALIGADNVHPTDEGHAYMENLILPYLAAAVS